MTAPILGIRGVSNLTLHHQSNCWTVRFRGDTLMFSGSFRKCQRYMALTQGERFSFHAESMRRDTHVKHFCRTLLSAQSSRDLPSTQL